MLKGIAESGLLIVESEFHHLIVSRCPQIKRETPPAPLDYYVMWIGGMAHVLGMFDTRPLFFPQSGLLVLFCLQISVTGKRDTSID